MHFPAWLKFALKFLLSAVLIGVLLRTVDLAAMGRHLADVSLGPIVLVLLIFAVLVVSNAVRWAVVMKAIDATLPFAKVLEILYIGTFFNQTLPSAVGGDAVRMYLARKAGLSILGAVNGVMLERAVALIGLIVLVVAVQPLLLARIGDNPAKWFFPILAGLSVVGLIFLMLLDRLPEGFRKWRLVRGVAHLAQDTRRLFLNPVRAVQAVALGVVGNVLISLIVYLLARDLNIPVSVVDCLVLVPPVVLITTIPVSIAGWGVREGAMVGAFAFVGVGNESALVLSLLFGVVIAVVSLPGGLVWLASGYSRKDVERETSAR